MEYFELAVHEGPASPSATLDRRTARSCVDLLGKSTQKRTSRRPRRRRKALQLDPGLTEAHTALGVVYEVEFDLRRAEVEFRRAIELKPSYATAHQWYFDVLLSELRWEEALKEIEKAVELDPLSGIIVYNLGEYYGSRRDFSRAVEKFMIAVELGFGAHGGLFYAYGMMKMYDQMDKEAETFARLVQDNYPRIRTKIDVDRAYFKGDKETVRRLLPELEAHPKETLTSATGIAEFHFFLGDIDEGFEWLERAYSKREGGLLGIQWDLFLDGVRTDSRYLDLLKRLGLNQTV